MLSTAPYARLGLLVSVYPLELALRVSANRALRASGSVTLEHGAKAPRLPPKVHSGFNDISVWGFRKVKVVLMLFMATPKI